jgi:hypothetical protein
MPAGVTAPGGGVPSDGQKSAERYDALADPLHFEGRF